MSSLYLSVEFISPNSPEKKIVPEDKDFLKTVTKKTSTVRLVLCVLTFYFYGFKFEIITLDIIV